MANNKVLAWIGILLLLLCLGGIGSFVGLSAQRPLSGVEATLFSILLLVFQMAFGFVTGWWFATGAARSEYRPFVRSALRRTYGLAEGMARVQDSIREGLRRMSTRTNIGSGARAQLWGELMQQVYSQTNELQRQAEASIQDWREFGRDELAKLEESQRLKDERIEDITQHLRELYELIGDLTVTPTASALAIDRMESVADSLQQELQTLRGGSVLSRVEATTVHRGEARKLMLIGAFEEAISVYSQIIDLNPTSHSLFIGRARARYLAGDQDGALADLDVAERLQPNDPVIKRAREQITEGRWFPVAVASRVPDNLAKAFEGTQALASGDIDGARRLFEEARKLGLSVAFARMDMAMAEILAEDPQAALAAVGNIDRVAMGRHMRVQIAGIEELCAVLEGEPDLPRLLEQVERCGDFSLDRSPLRFLETGLTTLGLMNDGMRAVFDTLRASAVYRPD